MPTLPHLLIPLAAGTSPGCRKALATLRLPNLERLLNRLTPTTRDNGEDTSLSPPHERALARHYGLPVADGQIPWAAHEAAQTAAQDGAWAWVTPCHWQVMTDHIVMAPPDTLGLEEAESRAVLAAVQPYFEEDGITLAYATPTRWLAQGEIFRGLATASLDRVVSDVGARNVDEWMPPTAQGGPLRRLQSEMQMLLYTHPVSDARAERGLFAINSFWVSGSGALASPAAQQPAPTMPLTLLRAAQFEDWAAWTAAWQHIDATACAELLAALDQGKAVQLTLCGESSAQSFEAVPRSFFQKISSLLSPQRLSNMLEQL
ncbi:phosphoglycerate mutase [Rhodoferax sp.]|uniref:phosphoglycerate mutase n=1 Tax=Rhodoferax sp. TaxID=50421 RepID=UPI0025D47B05|nr:phosphoglycerate mutase [Rhodoferax sp.]